MSAYPDTSFLCASYREQVNSRQADALFGEIAAPLLLTALVVFEFRQSVRWQTWLHQKDAGKGYGLPEGNKMLADFQTDLERGLVRVVPVDWLGVINRAEQLSAQRTGKSGSRAFDILHVATALELGVEEFLTFDVRQGALARALGLQVRP